MGNQRLEIVGVRQQAEIMYLKAIGCPAEAIDWKLRVFIPVNDRTVTAIEKIRSMA